EQLSAVRQQLDASKLAQEQERQARLKAEAENDELLQRLRQAQSREKETAAVLAQRRQRAKGERSAERRQLLMRLADARQRAAVAGGAGTGGRARAEEVLRTLLQLVRHLQRELQAMLDESAEEGGGASESDASDESKRQAWSGSLGTLILELRTLGDCLERCLRDWPELQLWLSDLAFALTELGTQAGRLQRLSDGKEIRDLARCQAVLEEVVRLSGYAAEALCPGAGSASSSSGGGAAAPPLPLGSRGKSAPPLPLGSRSKGVTDAFLQQFRRVAE
ncbi:unnamed protein product, partial [Polarella glacialis]